MEKFLKYLSYASVILSALFASVPQTMRLLLFAMATDILMGTIRAVKQRKLNSETAWDGILKKIATLGVIALVTMIDNITYAHIYIGVPIAVPVTGFYIYVECLSIVENAVAAGVPIPEILQNALHSLNPDKVPQIPPEG
jgi:toxin secretion/phage lysis holin